MDGISQQTRNGTLSSNDETRSPRIGERARRRGFVVGALLLSVVTWLVAYTVIELERTERFERDAEQAHRLAVFFEQQTRATFQYGDSYLKMIRRAFERSRDLEYIKELMTEVPLTHAIASHITIIDAGGTPIFNSRHPIKPGSSAGDREYFKAQKAARGDDLYLSLPHKGRNSGKLIVRMVRRFTAADGGFGGVMFIALDAKNITSFFNSMNLGPKSSATLVGMDKRIRARSSYGRLGPGQDISKSRIWRELERSPTGLYEQLSVVDGVLRHYAYRKLDEYPVVVAIGIAAEDLAFSFSEAYSHPAITIASIATLLILITAFLLYREIRTGARLASSEERMRTLVQTVQDGIVSFDTSGKIFSFSRGSSAIFGYTASEVAGRSIFDLLHDANENDSDTLLRKLLEQAPGDANRPAYWNLTGTRKDGSRFPAEMAVGKLSRRGRQFLVVTIRDVTDKQQAAAALFEARERAQVTLQSIGDAVISTRPDGLVDFLNPVAETLTGWSLADAVGQPLEKILVVLNEKSRKPIANLLEQLLAGSTSANPGHEHLLSSRDGSEFAIEESAAPILGGDGAMIGSVVVFRDVTEARRLSQAVNYQASHDILTGLVNRHEVEARLKRVRQTAQESDTENVFCFLDLDQFKLVNDTCGHVAGDELLRQIADLIGSRIRPRDTLGRLGGDEFGLLMEHCSVESAQRIAQSLIEQVCSFPFSWDGNSFRVGLSVGIVAVGRGGGEWDELMRQADAACYAAKEAGRNRAHVYRELDAALSQRSGEMRWAVRLPNALARGRFELHAQRILPLAEGSRSSALHYELLLRMVGDDGNLIAPGSFLPAAERYNFATEIDTWVVDHALAALAQVPEHLQNLEMCAINLSALSLNSDKFLPHICRQLEHYAIPPEKMCFEITETAAIRHLLPATDFITALRDRGCRFALDDFGIGLSSFAYLKKLPVDILKIDGMFVRDIVDDPTDFAFVRSINDIGRAMGKHTVAEFVETDQILAQIRNLGVNYAQGYGIARPVPLWELTGTSAEVRRAS